SDGRNNCQSVQSGVTGTKKAALQWRAASIRRSALLRYFSAGRVVELETCRAQSLCEGPCQLRLEPTGNECIGRQPTSKNGHVLSEPKVFVVPGRQPFAVRVLPRAGEARRRGEDVTSSRRGVHVGHVKSEHTTAPKTGPCRPASRQQRHAPAKRTAGAWRTPGRTGSERLASPS